MSLQIIPVELALIIVEFLERPGDLYALLRASRKFVSPISPILRKLSIDKRYAHIALYWAAAHGNKEMASFILGNCPRIVIYTGYGPYEGGFWRYPIHKWHNRFTSIPRPQWNGGGLARESDHIVDIALQGGPNLVILNREARQPLPALHWAVMNNHGSMLQLLLRKGADINIRGLIGQTALHRAAEMANESIARILIQQGADINPQDHRGSAPTWCIPAGEDRIAKFFYEQIDPNAYIWGVRKWAEMAISLAARLHGPTAIEVLVRRGADINHRDPRGRTPLNIALRSNNYVTAKFFLENGADVSSTDDLGRTALHIAIQFVHKGWRGQCVEMLLERGVDVNIQDKYGRTALHLAVKHQASRRVVERLLESGADVELYNEMERSPLHLAARKTILRTLLGCRADAKDPCEKPKILSG